MGSHFGLRAHLPSPTHNASKLKVVMLGLGIIVPRASMLQSLQSAQARALRCLSAKARVLANKPATISCDEAWR